MMLDCHTKSFGKGHHTRSQNMLYFVDSQDLFGIHLECHECGFIFKGANYVGIIKKQCKMLESILNETYI